jgi:hypothetical protein
VCFVPAFQQDSRSALLSVERTPQQRPLRAAEFEHRRKVSERFARFAGDELVREGVQVRDDAR